MSDETMRETLDRFEAKDAEIASLRSEVARLTAERDALLDKPGLARAFGRACEERNASRALCDRLAEALERLWALSPLPMDPAGPKGHAMYAARAALREWEEARRG